MRLRGRDWGSSEMRNKKPWHWPMRERGSQVNSLNNCHSYFAITYSKTLFLIMKAPILERSDNEAGFGMLVGLMAFTGYGWGYIGLRVGFQAFSCVWCLPSFQEWLGLIESFKSNFGAASRIWDVVLVLKPQRTMLQKPDVCTLHALGLWAISALWSDSFDLWPQSYGIKVPSWTLNAKIPGARAYSF